MIVHRIVSKLLSANMYIVSDDNRAFVIDPARDYFFQDNLQPDFIILTHEHYDHIAGVNTWKERFQIPVLCSEQCSKRIQNPKQNLARYYEAFSGLQTELVSTVPEAYEPDYTCKADKSFSKDTAFEWNGHTISILILPGHSPGSIGILVENCLFSGDSIFENQETVLTFPGGSAKDWQDISVPKIRDLPSQTIVYPGHFDHFELCKWKACKEEI